MPVETEIQPFLEWFPSGLLHWLLVAAALAVGAVVIGWILAAARRGPIVALRATARALETGAADLVRISPRRVVALAWLIVKESIRRPYLFVVFALFLLVLLYAGWFQPTDIRDPARYFIEFVLGVSGFLVLMLVLLLSSLSLSADIKGKTLHTVVTKPVRPSEIVLGRMLGFAAAGTLLLVVMGLSNYVFVVRLLSHTHEVTAADLRPDQTGGGATVLRGRTSREHGHRHDVVVDAAGHGRLEPAQGHTHDLAIDRSDDKVVYRVGPPTGQLLARVPVYGKLRFTDREGKPTTEGISTGDEWGYRSFVEGATLASAVWTFDGITEDNFPRDRFPHGLPMEMTIEVFRTYKGDTDDPTKIRGIIGSLAVRNPDTGTKVDVRIFEAKEFATDVVYVPYELRTSEGQTLDLFEDLAVDGKVEVCLRCEDPAQYFGVAQADLYFRARDASFELNFAKGYLGIWLQMVLVIGMGVAFSTFLSGPIAMMATAGMVLAGMVLQFIADLAAGLIPGGGPLESLIRLVTHQNVVSDMPPGLRTTIARMVDAVAAVFLKGVVAVMPAFGQFDFSQYVAYGYNVSANLAVQSLLRAGGFLLPVFVAGYFFLKLREIAK